MNLEAALQGLFDELDRSRGIPALLGDGAGNVKHSTILNCVWIRIIDTTTNRAVLATARNDAVPNLHNLAVYVKRTRKRGRRPYEVVGEAKSELYPSRTILHNVPPHAWTHLWPMGVDIISLAGRQILGCRAREQDTPGLTLQVDGGWYDLGGYKQFEGGNSPSFTAPATNWRRDLLIINSDGDLAIQQGIVGSVTGAKIPEATVGTLPLCAVSLVADQTTITEAHITDLRFVPRVSGTPAHASEHEPGGSDEITFPGAHLHAVNEDKSGECDGSKTVFLPANEFLPEYLQVLLNGQWLTLDDDYSEGSFYDAFTMTTAPVAGDALVLSYVAQFVEE